jgi:biopolymer transport protein ExbB/TolQ
MSEKIIRFLIALGLALLLQVVWVMGYTLSDEGGTASRLFELLGGRLPGGIVQFFTYAVFAFGILETMAISRSISREQRAYDFKLLPESEQYVLSPQDVNDLKLRVIETERREGKFILTKLIKRACTKYRANRSTSETLELVTNQVRINLSKAESEQSMIRYVAWAIPSIGFIGTILGIAGSLGNVQAGMGEEEIAAVTSALNVAFDTTLISLFLSILLLFYFHVVQERVEHFHADAEEYLLENLINRIYKS